MKRTIAILLLTALLLAGCTQGEKGENSVTFYYTQGEILYGSKDGVIAAEVRELSGTDTDLYYLMSLYMRGPMDETLKLPLPAGTLLTEILSEGTTVTLTFTSELSDLDGMDLSIACACLGFTCISLTEAETVIIQAPAGDSGSPVSFTVTRDSFLLYDNTKKAADAS